jgi:thiol-disulfide isomerase/thioredoxin
LNRRLLLGAGAAAAAAGAGLAWWQHRGGAPTKTDTTATVSDSRAMPSAAVGAASTPSSTGLWDLRLERPAGGELVLAGLRGRPLVVNFWATWCPPCVKELPEIDQFSRAQVARGAAGWQVLGIAIDKREAVQAFLKTTPVSYPIGLAGFAATELTRSLGNSVGGLPFTVVFDAAGGVIERKLGSTSLAELSGWASSKR